MRKKLSARQEMAQLYFAAIASVGVLIRVIVQGPPSWYQVESYELGFCRPGTLGRTKSRTSGCAVAQCAVGRIIIVMLSHQVKPRAGNKLQLIYN